MASSLVAMIRGMGSTSDDLAWYWTNRAVLEGLPNKYDQIIYYLLRGLILVMMVVGWVLLAHFTVFITARIFHGGA